MSSTYVLYCTSRLKKTGSSYKTGWLYGGFIRHEKGIALEWFTISEAPGDRGQRGRTAGKQKTRSIGPQRQGDTRRREIRRREAVRQRNRETGGERGKQDGGEVRGQSSRRTGG
jgi:hypothetical protein